MKLYLAVAVLLLALVAFTHAQDETFEEKVQRFGGQVVDGAKRLGENFHDSEFATNVREFFNRLGDRIKTGVTGLAN